MKRYFERDMMKKRDIITTATAILLLCGFVKAASIQEPSTVFYGKVIGTGDAQPFMVYEGDLVWTIQNANGSNIVFNTTLYRLHDGEFSYRLDIPHSAVAYDLDVPEFGIPLPAVAQTNSHVSASIDGVPVKFIGPSGESFTAGQVTRAATYRLDMALDINALDSDGDGLPDWWEDKMGLDKQDPTDASGDGDGDLVSNLNEYLASTDPSHDDRVPSITTEELMVFPESVTGVHLASVDLNTSADELTYTITQLPANGTLMLRNASENPVNPDQQLSLGAQFTQADVNSGCLVFVNDETDAVEDDALGLTLSDGGSSSNASATVKLTFYSEPENLALMSSAQKQRNRAYKAAQRSEVVLWDAVRSFEDVAFAAPSSDMTASEYASAYLPIYGDERGQVMTGGRGDDSISGGMADDTIVGGIGSDTLTGGGGADTFIFDEGDDANDVISDFNPTEGDRIDISDLLAARSGYAHDSIQFQIVSNDTYIGLNVDAGDSGFSSQVLKLAGIALDSLDGYELMLDGKVAIGSLKLQPCITVEATDAVASENGGNSGTFTFTRRGDLSKATDVNILVSGSALNGTDYSNIGSSVHFDPGESVVTLQVSPFADGNVESDEVVQVVLQSADGYCLGGDVQADLIIKDLQSVVSVEVLQAMGAISPSVSPAVVLVKRDGQTSNPLFVKLQFGGKAQMYSDYSYVNSYVEFAAGQATVAVQIYPLEGATLSDGAETVTIKVVEDSAYALADVASGSVVLVSSIDTLSSWQDRMAADSTAAPAVFAAQSSGVLGLDYLQCYAYGIDPTSPDSSLLPQISFRNGHFNVDVHQNPAATDLNFVVEASTDLQNWSSGLLRTVSVTDLVDEAGVVTYEAVSSAGAAKTLFVRVRVIYND